MQKTKSTNTSWIKTKCSRKVPNTLMYETKQINTYKDENNIRFSKVIRWIYNETFNKNIFTTKTESTLTVLLNTSQLHIKFT